LARSARTKRNQPAQPKPRRIPAVPAGGSGTRLGLWLIGAAGNVAATVAIGLAALRRGLATPIGLVTADPAFDGLGLVSPADIVLGGHDVRGQGVLETARAMQLGSGVFGDGLLDRVAADLAAYQREIRAGYMAGDPSPDRRRREVVHDQRRDREEAGGRDQNPARNRRADAQHRLIVGAARHPMKSCDAQKPAAGAGTLQAEIDRLARDIRDFAARHRCERVVVINVASTEAPIEPRPEHRNWKALSAAMLHVPSSPIRRGGQAPGGRHAGAILPPSSIYALAAIEAGCPYLNFTPSTGVDIPAIAAHAAARGVPIMGSDGKTGETLLKSALAPMFRHRALRILSWDGHNILGNRDGAVLADPAVKASKLRTKDGVVASALGYDTDTTVSIQHVPSLDDWKIAWDHVHFQGFLGVKMSLQFTWQGCDSILAAPLVIDLARLAEFHARTGKGGVMRHLACFFKRPMGCDEAGLPGQIDMLARYVTENAGHGKKRSAKRIFAVPKGAKRIFALPGAKSIPAAPGAKNIFAVPKRGKSRRGGGRS